MSLVGFILAVIPPMLYGVINHIDKLLLDKYFKEGGVGTLLLFSTLFSFFAIPYAITMDENVLNIQDQNIFIMYVVGVLNVVLLYAYLKALQKDDPTIVILYYQLVPVLALGMGYVVLGESITQAQAYAMAIILFGTAIATLEIDELNTLRFRWRTLGFMMVATTCWAAETTLGKIVVLDESVYRSIFWESVAMVTLGILIFCGVAQYRRQFIKALKLNSKKIIALNVFSEAVYGLGNAVITHAVLLAPVALVLLMQPVQSIFVFLWGVLFTLLIPQIYSEKISRLDIAQRMIAILITGYGSYLLLV